MSTETGAKPDQCGTQRLYKKKGSEVMARTVITIARQLGSGGDFIGGSVARVLGIPFLDHQIVEAAAAQAGTSANVVLDAEHVPGVVDRMLEYFVQAGGGTDRDVVLGSEWYALEYPFSSGLTRHDYRRLIEAVLKRTAAERDAVIVGHGGSVVLRDMPHVLKVLVWAPLDVRVERLQAADDLPEAEARRQILEDDRQRSDYFHTYYRVNWLDATQYDLCFNTGQIEPPAAVVEMILTAHARLSAPAMVGRHTPVREPDVRKAYGSVHAR